MFLLHTAAVNGRVRRKSSPNGFVKNSLMRFVSIVYNPPKPKVREKEEKVKKKGGIVNIDLDAKSIRLGEKKIGMLT